MSRGAPRSDPGTGGGETIAYLCSWEIRRSDDRWVSVVLSIEQVTRVLTIEVRDSSGAVRPLRFPIQDSSRLHEALSEAFFEVADDV